MIFEAHHLPGGQCTSWNRKGYVFDGCLHYFGGGGDRDTAFNRFWRELGAFPCDMVRPTRVMSAVAPDGTWFHDYYDLEKQHGDGSSVKAFSKTGARFLVVSFTSDWLYPTYQSKAIVQAVKKNNLDVSFCEIEAAWGHDAFLLPNPRLSALIKGFLESVTTQIRK